VNTTTEDLVFSTENKHLYQHHFNRLHCGSGISAEVITERGYVSLDQRKELQDCGFSYYQSRLSQLPGLLLPLWTPDGQQALFQYRSDTPRVDSKGRPIKYETPSGAGMRLDVPPRCRPALGDPSVPLFVTEGIKKGDALASHGLCAVALLGVWNFKGKNAKGGITWLTDWDYIALKARDVFVVYDSDVVQKLEVQRALRRLRAHLIQKDAKVTVLYLPSDPNGEKVGVDDYLLRHTVDELKQLSDEPAWAKHPSTNDDDPRPLINPDEKDMLKMRPVVWKAIRDKEQEDPEIFRYAGGLCRLEADESNKLIPRELTDKRCRQYLGNVVRFGSYRTIKEDDGTATEKLVIELVPMHVVDDILADPEPQVPPLKGIKDAPTIRPDGTIIDTPGYDSKTGIIYRPSSTLTMPDIHENPTRDDVRAALQTVWEPIAEFPYKDQASCANALGLLVTAIIASAIHGPKPLALLDKSTPGTGATLLAEVVGQIVTGRVPAMASLPDDDTELEKRITTLLRDSEAFVVFDNVDQLITHSSLALVTTASEWSGRILGKSEQARFPNHAIWCATGNNLAVRGDIARRCFWIRLDASTPQPWRDHRTYTHNPVLPWVQEHRGEIIGAVLTLARAWYAAGCPKANTPILGKFERWCEVIGGILAYAGVEDFLGNLDELYDKVDAEAPEWEAFLRAWHTHYGNREVSTTDVTRDLRNATPEPTLGGMPSIPSELADLRECVPVELVDALTNPRSSFERRLGRALAKRADRRYHDDGLRLVKGGSAGRPKWFVRVNSPSTTSETDDAVSLRVSASYFPYPVREENNSFYTPHINTVHAGTAAVPDNSQKLANSHANGIDTDNLASVSANGHASKSSPDSAPAPVRVDVDWWPKGNGYEAVPDDTDAIRYVVPNGLNITFDIAAGLRVTRWPDSSPPPPDCVICLSTDFERDKVGFWICSACSGSRASVRTADRENGVL